MSEGVRARPRDSTTVGTRPTEMSYLMYVVTIRTFVKTKSPKAKKRFRCTLHRTYSTADERRISEMATGLLRDSGKGSRFSGMEDFGSAHESWNDGHECPAGEPSDECEELELEACREWMEGSFRRLGPGEKDEFHLGLAETFSEFVVRRVGTRR